MDELGFNRQLVWLEATDMFNTGDRTILDVNVLNQIRRQCDYILKTDDYYFSNEDIMQLLIDHDDHDYDYLIDIVLQTLDVHTDVKNQIVQYLQKVRPVFQFFVERSMKLPITPVTYDIEYLFKLPDEFLVYEGLVETDTLTLSIWRKLVYKGGKV
jgi:hypothetical protein